MFDTAPAQLIWSMNDMLADSDRGTRKRGSSRDLVMFRTSLVQKKIFKGG